jgi:catalase-peroxidase
MSGSPDAYVDRTYGQTINARRSSNRESRPTETGKPHEWWRHGLDLRSLARPRRAANPLGEDFDYAKEFLTLNLDELSRDLDELLTTSQDWWPADFGHYGPLMLRMAWHSAGTYRVGDGRGGAAAGMQRFAPLNGWPDNRNLDKARRLLWPIKQKYGTKISWSDLMVFAGNRALESMGLKTFGFGGGREDVWEPDETYWGPEDKWFADERHSGIRDLHEPLAASEMGLIYADPQGPATMPDPIGAARDIRQTFRRMGMDDAETVALIAGGHTFGKTHGAADPSTCLGPEPDAAPIEQQGLGWGCPFGAGSGADTTTSGLEGIWTATPITWDNSFLETLFAYEWEVALSPAGMWQWIPGNGDGAGTVPDAHDPSKSHVPTVLTTDLALIEDPAYKTISLRFLENPDQMEDAFTRAWFKLTHIDMGPTSRYLGALVPSEPLMWQDPLPEVNHELIDAEDIAALKRQLLESDLTVGQLVSTAWASAATFRNSDKRGGANGAHIRLEPQRSWDVNEPVALAAVLDRLEQIQSKFNESQPGGKQLSLADLIVLGGCAGIELAADRAGHQLEVPFRPGRTDATQEWTDPEWFAVLEPKADAFRGYHGKGVKLPSEVLLVERAAQMTLSAPEMTVLFGGLRVIGINNNQSTVGVLTSAPGSLSNDYFVNLLDMNTVWAPSLDDAAAEPGYEGRDRHTDELKWVASRTDLIFSSSAELRAISEVYASRQAGDRFRRDFASAWVKVMDLGRFDR